MVILKWTPQIDLGSILLERLYNFHRKIKLKAFFRTNEHISENISGEHEPITGT